MDRTTYFLHETTAKTSGLFRGRVFFVADTPSGRALTRETQVDAAQRKAFRRAERWCGFWLVILILTPAATVLLALNLPMSSSWVATVVVGLLVTVSALLAHVFQAGTAGRLDPHAAYSRLFDSPLSIEVVVPLDELSYSVTTLDDIAALAPIKGKNVLTFLRAAGENGLPKQALTMMHKHLHDETARQQQARDDQEQQDREWRRRQLEQILDELPEDNRHDPTTGEGH